MNLQDITVNEINQSLQNNTTRFKWYEESKVITFTGTQSRVVNVSGWAEGDTGSCSVCAGFQLCKMKTFSNPLYNHMHTGESTAQYTKISERANLCYVFFTTMENKVIYSDKSNTFLLSFYPVSIALSALHIVSQNAPSHLWRVPSSLPSTEEVRAQKASTVCPWWQVPEGVLFRGPATLHCLPHLGHADSLFTSAALKLNLSPFQSKIKANLAMCPAFTRCI